MAVHSRHGGPSGATIGAAAMTCPQTARTRPPGREAAAASSTSGTWCAWLSIVQVTVTVAAGPWNGGPEARRLGSSVTVTRSTVCDLVVQMQDESARTPGMRNGGWR